MLGSKLLIISIILFASNVCHAGVVVNEEKPVYTEAQSQGPQLVQYSDTPEIGVEHVRSVQATPRSGGDFMIPKSNGFNVLDIADEHGTKIIYIKNAPAVQRKVDDDQDKMKNDDELRKDNTQQSVSFYESTQFGSFPFEITLPFGVYSFQLPIVLTPQRGGAAVQQSSQQTTVMRDPYIGEPAFSNAYPGGGIGYPQYGAGPYPSHQGYPGGSNHGPVNFPGMPPYGGSHPGAYPNYQGPGSQGPAYQGYPTHQQYPGGQYGLGSGGLGGPGIGGGPGPGYGPIYGSGYGPGGGPVYGSGYGPGDRPGYGPGGGPGYGPGGGPGYGPGDRPGYGPGIGPIISPGIGPIIGPGGNPGPFYENNAIRPISEKGQEEFDERVISSPVSNDQPVKPILTRPTTVKPPTVTTSKPVISAPSKPVVKPEIQEDKEQPPKMISKQ